LYWLVMSKPIAVLISDVHYNVHTIKLADAAVRMAIDKANLLKVPLIVAGDLHDTKANLRGECVNAMIETFKQCIFPPYILVGNHDRLNEKAPAHSLNFLSAYANIIDMPSTIYLESKHTKTYLVPYYHDANELREYLKTVLVGSIVIMHQGLTSSNSGDYIQDKSAINPEDVQDFRVISGHYHTRQDIKTGRPRKGAVGLWSYIGNPYSLGFGEANDPTKGYHILMDDGTLEFVPTNLRKHVIYEVLAQDFINGNLHYIEFSHDKDALWVKIKGSKEDLYKITRKMVSEILDIEVFKLDLIPTDTSINTHKSAGLTQGPLLDSLIDSLTNTSDERKVRLKDTWKGLCE